MKAALCRTHRMHREASIGRVAQAWVFRPRNPKDGFLQCHVADARHELPAAGGGLFSARSDLDSNLLAVLYLFDLARKVGKTGSEFQRRDRPKRRIHTLLGDKWWIHRQQVTRLQDATLLLETTEMLQLKEFDGFRFDMRQKFCAICPSVFDFTRFPD